MKDFDYILHVIGPFSRYQIIHWLLLSLAIIAPGAQNLLNVFIMATPQYRCHVTGLTNTSISDQPEIPEALASSCTIPVANHSDTYWNSVNSDIHGNRTLSDVTNTTECTHWEYEDSVFGTTAVTKWDLVCARSSMPAIAQSLYMLGFLLGAIFFGYVSDRFGRKITMYAANCGLVLFGTASCFMPEFWSHVITRMFTGAATCGSFTVTFVMVMEMVGPSKRQILGLCAQVFFAIGYMSLAGVAYLTRNFVWTNLIMSTLPAVLIFFWWTETESPRWLLVQGRVEEAKQILIKMAKTNQSSADIEQVIKEHEEWRDQLQNVAEKVDERFTIVDLLRTTNMRKKTLNILFNWCVISMVYYGLSMGVTDLAGDPHLNLFLSGVMECFSVAIMCLVLDRLGRRLCLASSLCLGGLACIVYGSLPRDYETVSIVLSMTGKLAISGSFAVIYVFSAELFPTVVRTIGVGAGSMSARFGGLMAPLIAELKVVWFPLPVMMFGGLAVTAGLLALLLPETLGVKLPDTLKEGEQFGKETRICLCGPSKDRNNEENDRKTDEKISLTVAA